MKGQRVGYIRVRTADQNPERQLADIQLDRIFADKASGATTDRLQLIELLNYIREGDTVVVHTIDRLARSLVHLRELVDKITAKGATIEFLKEHLTYTLAPSPFARLTLDITAAFADFERAIIRERQCEGIAIAKAKGVYKVRSRKLLDQQAASLRQRAATGEKKAARAIQGEKSAMVEVGAVSPNRTHRALDPHQRLGGSWSSKSKPDPSSAGLVWRLSGN